MQRAGGLPRGTGEVQQLCLRVGLVGPGKEGGGGPFLCWGRKRCRQRQLSGRDRKGDQESHFSQPSGVGAGFEASKTLPHFTKEVKDWAKNGSSNLYSGEGCHLVAGEKHFSRDPLLALGTPFRICS